MAKDPYRYFRIEARELLEGLGQGALELEKNAASRDATARLLRLAHTLKGAARVVKQAGIAELAHAVEDRLAPYREGTGPVPKDRIDEVLRLLDSIAGQIAALEPAAEDAGGRPPARSSGEAPFETVRVEIGEMDALLDGLAEVGAHTAALHLEIERAEQARRLAHILAEQLGTRHDGGLSGAPTAKLSVLAEDLRGALEGLKNRLSAETGQAEAELAQVRNAAQQLRLLPASAVFASLERTARDTAQTLRKRVDFEAAGGESRLDAHVLAALRDALHHVVRNAVAHGLEPEPERLAAGKPAAGKVRLQVERRGSRVAFVCQDDGQGIDLEAVRRSAVLKGLLPAAEAQALGMEEAIRLLLKGGLTTTATVTEVSGRGIGLDIVRATAARLNGEAHIRSEKGRGTAVELSVPVSLASLAALVVEAGDITASIPLDAVRGVLRAGAGQIAHESSRASIVWEGQVLPFLPLAAALRRPAHGSPGRRIWQVVVIQAGSAFAAVGVDRLLGATNTVLRPLPHPVVVEPVVSGASFDPSGNPQLVLDPGGLVEAARAARAPSAVPAPTPRPPLLVIDDSLTTRMLEQSILESAGYEVELAVSAEEALEKTRQRRYGLFVVDIEMPGMDGFEFVSRTRNDPALREIPAILVTSRSSAEDRRRGKDVGARAYIVKSEFDQGFLLQTIRGLLG